MQSIAGSLAQELSTAGQNLINLEPDRIVPLFEHPQLGQRRHGGKVIAELKWSDDFVPRPNTPTEKANEAGKTKGAKNGRSEPIQMGQISLKLSRVAAALKETNQPVPWEPARIPKGSASSSGSANHENGQSLSAVALAERECHRIVGAFTPSTLFGSCSRNNVSLHFHFSGEHFMRQMIALPNEVKPSTSSGLKAAIVYPRFPTDRALNVLDLRFLAAAIYVARQLSLERKFSSICTLVLPSSDSTSHLDDNIAVCRRLGIEVTVVERQYVLDVPENEHVVFLHELGTKSDIFVPLLDTRGNVTATRVFIGKTKWDPIGTTADSEPPSVVETFEKFEERAVDITKEKQLVRFGESDAASDDDDESATKPEKNVEALSEALARAAILFPVYHRGLGGETKLSNMTFELGAGDSEDESSDHETLSASRRPENQHGAVSTAGVFVHYVLAKLGNIVSAGPHAEVAEEDMVLPRELLPAFLHLARAPHLFAPPPSQTIALFDSGAEPAIGIPNTDIVAKHLYVLASLISSATYSVRVKDFADDAMREGRRRAFATLKSGLEYCCRLCGMDPAGEGAVRM